MTDTRLTEEQAVELLRSHNIQGTAEQLRPYQLRSYWSVPEENLAISSVTWAVTHRCNLRCTHCYDAVDCYRTELNTAQALTAINRLAESGHGKRLSNIFDSFLFGAISFASGGARWACNVVSGQYVVGFWKKCKSK